MTLKELRKALSAVLDKEGKEAEDYNVVADFTTIEEVMDVEVRDIIKVKKVAGKTDQEIESTVRIVCLS